MYLALERTYHKLRKPTTLGVKIIAMDDEGGVMLVKHTYRPGWHLPGGKVDTYEPAIVAAQRELREETGLLTTLNDLAFVGFYSNFTEHKSDHIAVFATRRFERDAAWKRRGFEISHAEMFRIDDFPDDTSGSTRKRVEEFLNSGVIVSDW